MRVLTSIVIRMIKIYQFLVSPILGHSCRYFPTCSEYTIDALKTYGPFKGIFMGLKRILSCHPWADGGFEPVKKEMKEKK